ncbi:hypothetical protein ACFV2X_52350 [Streptomyces sp. NPDC059679]|uniref:hypothetical protein n=1 Tax=Streptomyces sp. NPDC059679 TaxID=3346903 RepID=UPI00369592AB
MDELQVVLNALRTQISIARALKARDSHLTIDLSNVDDGRANFERNVGPSGLPSSTVLNTAKKRAQEVVDRLTKGNQEAWTTWTRQSLSNLPLARIAMLLEPETEEQATSRHAELVRIARSKPSKDAITTFATVHDGLWELLHDTEDPPEALASLLERLRTQPDLTLRDVTDEEIALIRKHGMDAHISLKRKGS